MIARTAAILGFAALAVAAAPRDCAPCHREANGFAQTAMARALVPAAESAVLKSRPGLRAKIGGYTYEIAGTTLVVNDGQETVRAPLDWAFGDGKVGQTWLYRSNGAWRETRVSYFAELDGLDITIGQQGISPRTLEDAAGRIIGSAEATRCFDCHATGTRAQPISPGVLCERCHGATESHLRSGSAMKKLSALSTEELTDFCGQCHRTWSQVAAGGPRGIQNIRFQPYRLAGSKCYSATDSRMKCAACHDPHRPLETALEAYDVRCGACHRAQGSAAVCRIGVRGCAGCHMPKMELPGAHRRFTDHRIRVVRAGEAYPD